MGSTDIFSGSPETPVILSIRPARAWWKLGSKHTPALPQTTGEEPTRSRFSSFSTTLFTRRAVAEPPVILVPTPTLTPEPSPEKLDAQDADQGGGSSTPSAKDSAVSGVETDDDDCGCRLGRFCSRAGSSKQAGFITSLPAVPSPPSPARAQAPSPRTRRSPLSFLSRITSNNSASSQPSNNSNNNSTTPVPPAPTSPTAPPQSSLPKTLPTTTNRLKTWRKKTTIGPAAHAFFVLLRAFAHHRPDLDKRTYQHLAALQQRLDEAINHRINTRSRKRKRKRRLSFSLRLSLSRSRRSNHGSGGEEIGVGTGGAQVEVDEALRVLFELRHATVELAEKMIMREGAVVKGKDWARPCPRGCPICLERVAAAATADSVDGEDG